MSDHFHLSNEQQQQQQQSYEYVLAHGSQLTESPSTTSSPISPLTSIAQQHPAMFNWQPTTTSFDPSLSQYYYGNVQEFQQQQGWPVPQPYLSHSRNHISSLDSIRGGHYYQQPSTSSLSYIYQQLSHAVDTSADIPYAQRQEQPQFRDNSIPNFNSKYTTAAPIGEEAHVYHPHLDSNHPSPSAQTGFDQGRPEQDMKQSNSPRYQPKKDKMKKKQMQKVTKYINTTGSTSPPSPNTTPLPSPILGGNKRKRRASVTSVRSKKKDGTPEKAKRVDRSQEEDDDLEGGVFESHDGNNDTGTTLKRGGNQTKENRTVDQMENELAFLRDECATISIMLDSLRNAFLADIPSSSTLASAKRIASSTATINFMVENLGNTTNQLMATSQNRDANKSVSVDKRRRSKTLAQNPEMEREMRIAYDDLMLQVRQLEKKVERLEGKSKRMKKDDVDVQDNMRQEDQPADQQLYTVAGEDESKEEKPADLVASGETAKKKIKLEPQNPDANDSAEESSS